MTIVSLEIVSDPVRHDHHTAELQAVRCECRDCGIHTVGVICHFLQGCCHGCGGRNLTQIDVPHRL